MILPALFAATLFLSAGLLFSIQPVVAKMLLPLLGGTPAVWTTCMVFFQAMLLAGYVYAHLISNKVTPRVQCAVHGVLLLAAGLSLPFGVTEESIRDLTHRITPTTWLLACLFKTVGLPFFVISASAPLLQRWFSTTEEPSAKDPYFLYAASNLGSLVALLSYPWLVEPNLRLTTQSRLWSAGYCVLGVLLLTCLGARWWARTTGDQRNYGTQGTTRDSCGSESHRLVTVTQRFRWIALAFVPSSLMLGVTTYLTTDIASIPLLWVVPLSLYLLTFVLTFGNKAIVPQQFWVRALPIGAVSLAYLFLTEATQPAWLLILLHLFFLFVAGMVCHGQLADERPSATRLTEFYMWLSVGGMLGGLFNGLVAPAIFQRVIEYPAAMVLACMLRPSERQPAATRWQHVFDSAVPLGLGLGAAALAIWVPSGNDLAAPFRLVLIFGVPLTLAYTLGDRSLRFGLGLSAVLIGGSLDTGGHGHTLCTERNFFGVLRVTLDPDGAFHRLVHGNTVHGRQYIDPARHSEPLSYYHRSGPLGQIFKVFDNSAASTNVAVVGLGAGSMSCYAKPHQHWTYYEINPAVVKVAQDTNYFTFLSGCRAAQARMVVGDARLRLREAPDAFYNLIVLDAFSSDSIPMHLITREAIDLYLSKLAERGLLVFHISNRCLEFEPVLGDLAGSAKLVCFGHDEVDPSAWEAADGKDQSHWVTMARRVEDLGRLIKDSRWLPVTPRAKSRVWTDDFSNIWSVFKWR